VTRRAGKNIEVKKEILLNIDRLKHLQIWARKGLVDKPKNNNLEVICHLLAEAEA